MSSSPVAAGLRPRVRLPKAKPNIMGGARRSAGTKVSAAVTTVSTSGTPPKPAVVATEPRKEIKSPPPVRRMVDMEMSKPVHITNDPSPNPQPSALDNIDKSESTEPSNLPSTSSASADACIKGTVLKKPSQNTEKPSQQTTVVSSSNIKKVRKPSTRSGNENRDKDEVIKVRPKKGQAPPERGKMTMFDLIFWNPESNPMTYEDERHTSLANKEANTSVLPTENAERLAEEAVDDPECVGEAEVEDASKEISTENKEESMPVPQVKIGPDGNIILDEQSLVIETTASKIDISSSPIVYGHQNNTTYTSFRKQRATKTWSDRETAKFYVALSAVGTDFSMMANLFPKRERKELKLKFKREERLNRELIDKTIRDNQQYDLSIFDESEEELENQLAKSVENAKKIQKSRRNPGSGQGRKQKQESSGQNGCEKQQGQRKKPRGKKPMLQEEDDSDYEEADDAYVADMEAMDVSTEQLENPQSNSCDQEAVECLVVDSATESTLDLIEENDDAEMLEGVLKQTRCGRQPKKRAVFTILNQEPKKRTKKSKPDDNSDVLTQTEGVKTYTNEITAPQEPFGEKIACRPFNTQEICPMKASPIMQSETPSSAGFLHNTDNTESREIDLEETICNNNTTASGTAEQDMEDEQDEENCHDYKILEGVLKQTRSGRQPKMKSVFTIDTSKIKKEKKERGLLNQTLSPTTVVCGYSPLANPLPASPRNELYMLAEKPAEDGTQVVHLYMMSPPLQPSPISITETATVPDHDYVLQNLENIPVNTRETAMDLHPTIAINM